jgi:transcriptional regulator with XRE-family HTH domain
MRDRKTETLVYKGLGFPIKLIDVPMKKMFGDWVIDIDMTELQLIALRALVYKPVRLTKEELKFIRHFLSLTTTQFGKIFGVRHSAVVQWENGKRNISPSIEICIRLYALNHLRVKDKEFRSLYNKLSIEKLSEPVNKKFPLIEIDASEDLKIAL